jgi:hypothetical protein
MPAAQKPVTVRVSVTQRRELEALLRRTNVSAGLARRARAILLLADGNAVSATSRLVAMPRRHLDKGIDRFRH